jgi:Permuted papain-like amidase enzyme, YaeF/YiiX, C92 family
MNNKHKAVLTGCFVGVIALVIASLLHVSRNIDGKDTAYNKHLADYGIAQLASGDIVLRMGLGADSRLLAGFNLKNKSYSHCGIVMIEDGYPFVYHSIGGEDNPDMRLRRDSASNFFSPAHNTAVAIVQYDLAPDKLSALRSIVREYYKLRPRFDLKFDLSTDDKLYCAEFVYKAVNKAAGNIAYIVPTQVAGLKYVSIDNLFINTHAHIVWQTVYK